MYLPAVQVVHDALPAAANSPAEQAEQAEAESPASRFLPAGQAWRGWRTSVQQRGQRKVAGFKATVTIGTPSVRKQQDEKLPRVWRMTWQVFEVAVTLP